MYKTSIRLLSLVALGMLVTFLLRVSSSADKTIFLISDETSPQEEYKLYLKLRNHLNPENVSVKTTRIPKHNGYSIHNEGSKLVLESPVRFMKISSIVPELTISLKEASLVLSVGKVSLNKQPGTVSFIGEVLSALLTPSAREAEFLLEWNSHLHFRSPTNVHQAYAKLLYGNLLTKNALISNQHEILQFAINEFGSGFKKFKHINNPDLSLALGNNLTIVSCLNNILHGARDHRRRVHMQTFKKLVKLAKTANSSLYPNLRKNLKIMASVTQDDQIDDPRRHVM